MKRHETNLAKAQASWLGNMPDWVAKLAGECDLTSQRVVANRLGKSGGYVSRIINCEYAGSYEEAERQVRATLADEQVDCPAFGPMPLAVCIRGRRRKTPAENAMHRTFDRHCPRCPFNTDLKDD